MTKKNPTIKNLLSCLPKNGLETTKDQLELYAYLSFYFDGEDLSKAKVNKIRAKMKVMDEICSANSYEILELDDSYDLVISDVGTYRFNVPSLETMPAMNKDNPSETIKDSINKLAENPEPVLKLGYQYFPAIVEVLGKSIGI